MSFGTFHREAGGLCGLGEPTVSFTVCRTICGLRRQNINFPDAETWVNYKFYEFGNFPGVIGCISGTTKRRSIPDAEQYRNPKNWFSINVQGVCTPQLQFSNILSCLKGVTHDSWILTHHSLCLEEEMIIIVAWWQWACSKFLFTPHLNYTWAKVLQPYAHWESSGARLEESFSECTSIHTKKLLHCH